MNWITVRKPVGTNATSPWCLPSVTRASRALKILRVSPGREFLACGESVKTNFRNTVSSPHQSSARQRKSPDMDSPHRCHFELNLEESLPPVPADGEAIRSALLNLILNSFEAMPRGGSLTIDLHADGEEIVLSVADTGEGIPEEDHEHVFDFAYTTRDDGHGLGLAMVHHCVVEEHGGRVSLESSQGEGTRVSMTLPIRAPEVS